MDDPTHIPNWAKVSITIGAILLFLLATLTLPLHLIMPKRFPPPTDLEAEIFLGLSLITLFGLHFPWEKIKFGDWEVERKRLQADITEQAIETGYAIEDIISDESAKSSKDTGKHDLLIEGARNENRIGGTESNVDDPIQSKNKKYEAFDADKMELFQFFEKSPTRRYTPEQIINFAARNKETINIASFSMARLRILLPVLVKERKIRIVIGDLGTIQYEFNRTDS